MENNIIKQLKLGASKKNLIGMARFGINTERALGVSIPYLRGLAKEIGKDHVLAQKLWNTKIHEARILASLVDDPKLVTARQMDLWVKDFNSWDVCDQTCSNLFSRTSFAFDKAVLWSRAIPEFVKRAGFAMMACLAVHDKAAEDQKFIKLFPIIKCEAVDERNFVKKAVNWALRQIGKRNKHLHCEAIKVAQEIQKIDSRSARWIAGDALRELQNVAIKKRLR